MPAASESRLCAQAAEGAAGTVIVWRPGCGFALVLHRIALRCAKESGRDEFAQRLVARRVAGVSKLIAANAPLLGLFVTSGAGLMNGTPRGTGFAFLAAPPESQWSARVA